MEVHRVKTVKKDDKDKKTKEEPKQAPQSLVETKQPLKESSTET
jgi:hypothetical protein